MSLAAAHSSLSLFLCNHTWVGAANDSGVRTPERETSAPAASLCCLVRGAAPRQSATVNQETPQTLKETELLLSGRGSSGGFDISQTRSFCCGLSLKSALVFCLCLSHQHQQTLSLSLCLCLFFLITLVCLSLCYVCFTCTAARNAFSSLQASKAQLSTHPKSALLLLLSLKCLLWNAAAAETAELSVHQRSLVSVHPKKKPQETYRGLAA